MAGASDISTILTVLWVTGFLYSFVLMAVCARKISMSPFLLVSSPVLRLEFSLPWEPCHCYCSVKCRAV